MRKGTLLPILRILSTHGLKGEVKVLPLTKEKLRFSNLKKLFLEKDHSRFFEVESIRTGPKEGVYLLKLKGVDLQKAQELINSTFYVEASQLPEPEEGEVYFFELEGLNVESRDGKIWGQITEVMPLGEYLLLKVKSQEADFYLPLVPEYVEEISSTKGKLFVKDLDPLVEVLTEGKATPLKGK